MVQKIQTYITKRSVECISKDRFVFFKKNNIYASRIRLGEILNSDSIWSLRLKPNIWLILFMLLTGIFSCGEPEIKLTRADRKSIDTLVNNQLDSISPILDSLCFEKTDMIIEKAVDSIIKERQKQEKRLRLGDLN